MIRYVVVTAVANVMAEGEVEEERFGDRCRELVGGYFEVVHLPGPGIDLWIDEEGKFKGYTSNEWATAAAFHGKAGLGPWDFIMGNVVATGGVGPEGETLGLSDEQLAWLRKVEI